MRQAICIMVEYTNPAEPPEKWDWPGLLFLPESAVQLLYIGETLGAPAVPATTITPDVPEDARIALEAIDAMSGAES